MTLQCYDHFNEEGCTLLALLLPNLFVRNHLLFIFKLSIILLLYSALMLENKNDKSISYLQNLNAMTAHVAHDNAPVAVDGDTSRMVKLPISSTVTAYGANE